MKYFIKPSGEVFAFEQDGSQDHLITADMLPMSQAQVAAHLTPPPPPVPSAVTNAQGKAALILMGLDDDVEAFIASIPDPVQRKLALNDYNNRLTWERSNERLNTIATALGFDLDTLFTLAAQQ